MRDRTTLLLAVGLVLAACDDGGGPSTVGTLVISTATGGGAPDQDGYLLTVDGLDSLFLDPTGTSEKGLRSGQHTLRLLGVAEHCSVAPGTSLEVDVPSQGIISVVFDVSCPATAVRITTTTTGLDIDPSYRVMVDGTDRGTIPSNGAVVTRLDPGSHTIAITGLKPNCTIDGPPSRTATLVDPEVVPIEFAVLCTATSGVIGVIVKASAGNVNEVFEAMLDGGLFFFFEPGGPHYFTPVSAGDYLVSLVGPPNCSVATDTQLVTVTVGELIRDTVEVAFSVTCAPPSRSGNVRITAPTTGAIPPSTRYIVMHEVYGYWDYGGIPAYLGALDPNGILITQIEPTGGSGYPYWNLIGLVDIPLNCSVRGPNPTSRFTLMFGATLDIEFPITCSP